MIVLELKDTKYGKVMRAVQDLEKSLECIKETLTDDAIAMRSSKRDEHEKPSYDRYEDYDKDDKEGYHSYRMSNRYM